jgi:hypothetical protein
MAATTSRFLDPQEDLLSIYTAGGRQPITASSGTTGVKHRPSIIPYSYQKQ